MATPLIEQLDLRRTALASTSLTPELLKRMYAEMHQDRDNDASDAIDPYSSSKLEEMMRMRLRSARSAFFKHWHAFKDGETVHVMVVNNGQSVLLKDDFSLFPSDQLITALRLLENS